MKVMFISTRNFVIKQHYFHDLKLLSLLINIRVECQVFITKIPKRQRCKPS